jgi:Spy/CpxP family protein refolding chaperone
MHPPSQNPSTPPPPADPDIRTLEQLLQRQDKDEAAMRKLRDSMAEIQRRITETSEEITKKEPN